MYLQLKNIDDIVPHMLSKEKRIHTKYFSLSCHFREILAQFSIQHCFNKMMFEGIYLCTTLLRSCYSTSLWLRTDLANFVLTIGTTWFLFLFFNQMAIYWGDCKHTFLIDCKFPRSVVASQAQITPLHHHAWQMVWGVCGHNLCLDFAKHGAVHED